MILGYIPPIEIQAAETTASASRVFSKSERATKVNVVPSDLKYNDNFMKTYVRRSNTMNINNSFIRYKTENADGASERLPTHTIDGDKSKNWYASYKWTPNEAEQQLLNNRDFELVYEGTMTPDWHKHWYIFWTEKHWSVSGIRLTRGVGDNTWTYGENDYGYRPNGDVVKSWMAEYENDEKAQPVSASWRDNFVGYYNGASKSLFLNAYYLWEHGCGRSSTGGHTFYFVDRSSTYGDATADAASYQTIQKGGTTHTITVSFGEFVRFADNAAHDGIKLYLNAYWGNQTKIGQPNTEYVGSDGKKLTAKFTEMGLDSNGNTYMKFQYTIPDSVDHVYVTGISGNQPDFNKETDLVLYNKDGDDIGARNLKSSTLLVNRYGSSIDGIRDSMRRAEYDSVKPTLREIDMSGKDISATSKVPSSWADNSGNNRYIYAGAGDTVTFKAYYSESVKLADQKNAKAVLSIKGDDGNFIKLGVKSVNGDCITFDDLKVTQAMKEAGTRITVTGLENFTVTDKAGNALSGDSLKTPAQDITLDVDKPVITTTATATNGVYMDGSGLTAVENGRFFSFPVTFSEAELGVDNSGISGMNVKFTLSMPDDSKFAYGWYMDTNQAISYDAQKYIGGTTGTANTFKDVSDGTQYWIHFKLLENLEYNYADNVEADGVYFNAKLRFDTVSDWAGNTSDTAEFTLKHQVDTEGPGGAMTTSLAMTPDYANDTATFRISLHGTDNFRVEKITYQWLRKLANDADWVAVDTQTVTNTVAGISKEFTCSPTYTYDYSSAANADRAGQVMLKATVEDCLGKAYSFESEAVSFNFVRPVNESFLSNGGTAVAPVLVPGVAMKAPSYPAEADYGTDETYGKIVPRTILLIPNEQMKDESGNYTAFWIWDPWDFGDVVGGEAVEGGPGYQYSDDPIGAMVAALDTYRADGNSDPLFALPGMFYYAEGEVDLANASGVFTYLEEIYLQYNSIVLNLEDLRDYIGNFYGAMDLYMVTTTDLREFTASPYPSQMAFTSEKSTIAKATAYLANNAQYSISVESIVNADGLTDAESVAAGGPALDYDPDNNVITASNLDNVSVTFRITNASDAVAVGGQTYGYSFLNTAAGNASFKLYYTGNSKPYPQTNAQAPDGSYELVANWDLGESSDGIHTVVFEPGQLTKNGWYFMKVCLHDNQSNTDQWFDIGRFMMDATVLDVSIDTFEKAMDSEDRYLGRDFTWVQENLEATYEADGAVNIGLAPMPEGWTEESLLTFSYTGRPESDPLFGSMDSLRSMSKVRVYNKTFDMEAGLADETGVWRSAYSNFDGDTFDYVPVLTDSADADPYGMTDETEYAKHKLPMVPGYNVIVYEIMSTNGIVTTKEIVINVDAEADDFQLEYELQTISGIGYTGATVLPLDLTGMEFTGVTDERNFTLGEYYFGYYLSRDYQSHPEYSFTRDVDDTFYLIDPNGNVAIQHLTITDAAGNVLDIDGEAPYSVGTTSGTVGESGYWNSEIGEHVYDQNGDCFNFRIYAYDRESSLSPKNLTITFDEDYSRLLMSNYVADEGAAGDLESVTYEDSQCITIPVPLALDENGDLLMVDTDGDGVDDEYAVWESFDAGNYGIYRTQVKEVGIEVVDEETGEEQYHVDVEIWGTWKHDPTYDYNSGSNPDYRTLTVGCYDERGNGRTDNRVYYMRNPSIRLEIGSLTESGTVNGDLNIDAEGNVGLYSNYPLSSIDGYGAGSMIATVYDYYGYPVFYTTAPMIVRDTEYAETGEFDDYGYPIEVPTNPYMFSLVDLFGQRYDYELTVDIFGETGVNVSFSETDMTNQDVTVFAVATGEYGEIVSITSDKGVEGVIDPADPRNASITVSENCVVTVTAKDGTTRIIPVKNIDKVLDQATVIYYNEAQGVLDPNDEIPPAEVTAVLICDTENLFATNGPNKYTFLPGSKAGDTYTFEYQDLAGNTGTLTATLPVDVPVPAGESATDTEAPELTVNLYAYMKGKLEMIDSYENAETAEEVTGQLNSEANKRFKTQKMRFTVSIQDTSDTKVIVAPAGSSTPTDYASAVQGSTNEHITMNAGRKTVSLDITENTVFDIHVIDAAGNCTSITGLTIRCIDLTAPEMKVEYEPGIDPETGFAVVTATFVPKEEADQFDTIIPITADVAGKQVILQDENGNDVFVTRYYHIFRTNGQFDFDYMDETGNIGEAVAQVQGMSSDAAVVTNATWFGTRKNGVGNCTPSISDPVNNDVYIQLRMSKGISGVELFEFNGQMEDGIGAQLDENSPVKVSVTGTNIEITYTDNMDKVIIARFTTSESGRKGTYTLPTVNCIDKTAPAVTLKSTTVSANKRSISFVFETDEPTLLSQNALVGYKEAHTWVVKDNDPVTLSFSDKAGNLMSYTLDEFSGLDMQKLDVTYSASADGSNPTDDPAKDMPLEAGQTFYVMVNKAAQLAMNGVSIGQINANTWTAVKLPNYGGIHIIKLIDSNTGDEVLELVSALPLDVVAPVIELDSNTILVNENASADDMMAAINSGVTVTDNKDPDVTLTVTGYPADTTQTGLYSLTYTAEDSAGNSVTTYRYLYIMAEGTPMLWINGEVALPYGNVIVKSGDRIEITLSNMDDMENQPMVIKYGKGLLTTGQMKYFGEMVDGLSFTVDQTGHYTVYFRSQDRTEFVTYIYVEG